MRRSSSTFLMFSQSKRWIVITHCPMAPTILRSFTVGSQHFAILYGMSRAFPMMTFPQLSHSPFHFSPRVFFFSASFFSSIFRHQSSAWMISSWMTLRILDGLRDRFPSCTRTSSRHLVSRVCPSIVRRIESSLSSP